VLCDEYEANQVFNSVEEQNRQEIGQSCNILVLTGKDTSLSYFLLRRTDYKMPSSSIYLKDLIWDDKNLIVSKC
jgi:hypothetical protein